MKWLRRLFRRNHEEEPVQVCDTPADPKIENAELRAREVTIRADRVVVELDRRHRENHFAQGLEAWVPRRRTARS